MWRVISTMYLQSKRHLPGIATSILSMVQEHVDSKRVVCFSPDKRESIKEKETSKTPVRILNVSPQKRKFQLNTIEYKMGGRSKVVTMKNIPFAWVESVVKKQKRVSIGDIVSSGGNLDDLVSVNAMVYFKGERQSVYSHAMRKSLTTCNLVIADETAAIRASVWESMIDEVVQGQSYEFQKFKINFFNNKYLNGTPELKLCECKVVELPAEISEAAEAMKPKTKVKKQTNGRIVGADVNICLVCMNCKKGVENVDHGNKFIDCEHCKLSMLKDFLKPTITANLVLIDEDGGLGRFHCSQAVLDRLFESLKGNSDYSIEESDVTELSRQLITETLLLLKKVSFELLMDDMEIATIAVPWVF